MECFSAWLFWRKKRWYKEVQLYMGEEKVNGQYRVSGYFHKMWLRAVDGDNEICQTHCWLVSWLREKYWLWITCLNSLEPSDAMWWQKTGSTLAQVMACCLTASSHYLNQCWLITKYFIRYWYIVPDTFFCHLSSYRVAVMGPHPTPSLFLASQCLSSKYIVALL